MVPGREGYIPDSSSFPAGAALHPDLHHPDYGGVGAGAVQPPAGLLGHPVREWNKIGRVIARDYDRYDGFVVLHGTDTMAYSASRPLLYAGKPVKKPVVFTGAQIPLCQLRSDGRGQISSTPWPSPPPAESMRCASISMGCCCGATAPPGYSSDQFAAFDSPNAPHLADVGIQIGYHESRSPPPVRAAAAQVFEKSPSAS